MMVHTLQKFITLRWSLDYLTMLYQLKVHVVLIDVRGLSCMVNWKGLGWMYRGLDTTLTYT